MATVLEYGCGCEIYSDKDKFEVMHLCTDHKIQASKDALQERMDDEWTITEKNTLRIK